MIKVMLWTMLILFVLCLLLFSLWNFDRKRLKKLKAECESLSTLNDSYKKIQEIQIKEKMEIEKGLQASVGNGSSDSFNSSIDLLQKLSDKGKSRS